MIAAVPKELFPSERRVAVTPAVMPALGKAGVEFRIESGAGQADGYADAAYAERGAKIATSRDELFPDLCRHGCPQEELEHQYLYRSRA